MHWIQSKAEEINYLFALKQLEFVSKYQAPDSPFGSAKRGLCALNSACSARWALALNKTVAADGERQQLSIQTAIVAVINLATLGKSPEAQFRNQN
jgi:hypothetical protein